MDKSKKKLKLKKLSVQAHVSENKLHLGQVHISVAVKLPDGTKVEISTLNCLMFAVITRPNKKGWSTYTISPNALIEAVLKAEGVEP